MNDNNIFFNNLKRRDFIKEIGVENNTRVYQITSGVNRIWIYKYVIVLYIMDIFLYCVDYQAFLKMKIEIKNGNTL